MMNLGFGLIGAGFMGRAHAIALSAVGSVFDDVGAPRSGQRRGTPRRERGHRARVPGPRHRLPAGAVGLIDTDQDKATAAGGAWWDVPVASVSASDAVRRAHATYRKART